MFFRLDEKIYKKLLAKDIMKEIPRFLYHATYKEYWEEIKKKGYLGNTPHSFWGIDTKGSYLTSDKESALEFMKEADTYENRYQDIKNNSYVVLKIPTNKLNLNYLFVDPNYDFEDDGDIWSFKYDKVIPTNNLEIEYEE